MIPVRELEPRPLDIEGEGFRISMSDSEVLIETDEWGRTTFTIRPLRLPGQDYSYVVEVAP